SEPSQLTHAPEGVLAYELPPEGDRRTATTKSGGGLLVYLTRDPMPTEEERQRQDKSFVIHTDAPDRPTRIAIQAMRQPSTLPGMLTRLNQYVDGFPYAPDAMSVVYSAAPRSGFSAPYEDHLYRIGIDGGEPRTIVGRPGMNSFPKVSPDGKL